MLPKANDSALFTYDHLIYNLYLVFGNEGHGLPEEFYERYSDKLCIIPMPGEHSRSLNLANSVALGIYEGLRQDALR